MERGGLDAFFDQAKLKSEAYADSTKVTARADIYRFSVPDIPFQDWALSHLPHDLGAVLDVGCGPGLYLRNLAEARRAGLILGVDLSDGMLREVQGGFASLCVADAQYLPFRSEAFDTALCMHVLYHVADISVAVAELRRVVKHGGFVLVATNGANHQRRLRELFDDVLSELAGGPAPAVLASVRRFRLEEAGEMLGTHFDSVERFDLPRELVVPDAEPVVRYLESIRSFHEARLSEAVAWEEVVKAFRGRVKGEIGEKGSFRSPIHAGVFVCR